MKFLVPMDQASAVDAWASANMIADPFAEQNQGLYQVTSLYLDSPAWDVFHRRGSYGRAKYRIRRYGTADSLFLERKLKKGTEVAKTRSLLPLDQLTVLAAATPPLDWSGSWFHRRIAARRLQAVCQISYSRSARMAASENGAIRLTIDRDIRALPCSAFAFAQTEGALISAEFAILELKYRREIPVLFKQLLQRFSLMPQAFSKYRTAVAALGLTPDA